MKSNHFFTTSLLSFLAFPDKSLALPNYRKWNIGQTVCTSSGDVTGHPASSASQVSEYLGIPYAQPPVGNLRFAAPEPYQSSSPINGTNFGFSCPISSIYSSSVNPSLHPSLNFTASGEQILSGFAQINEKFGEDCLTLNVWTKPQTGERTKAVLLWIPGGGFVAGSATAAAYNGQFFADQEDVVIVSINYRVNIFGFPGFDGAGNLGLLDQRLAVKWVRDNIAKFGGDPSRITLFGQSAGAESINFYSYAYQSDPIASGYIIQSATTALSPPLNMSSATSLWYAAASALGCGNATTSSPSSVLSCMRNVSTSSLTTAISTLSNFLPVVDDTLVFSNYASRSPSQTPLLIGHTNNEAGLFSILEAENGLTPPPSFWATFNLESFFCPTSLRANVSIANSIPTWRYRYFGEFENMELTEQGNGAWHGSEVYQLFDNVPIGTGIPRSLHVERETGRYIRAAWATFAKDSKKGLSEELGWPTYDPDGETLVRLGFANNTGLDLAVSEIYDSACSGVSTA